MEIITILLEVAYLEPQGSHTVANIRLTVGLQFTYIVIPEI
jgi:hypothetical protein